MNEFLKATRKMPIRRFYETNRTIDKSLVFLGAAALLFVGAKLLLNGIGDLSAAEKAGQEVINGFRPRR